jgi:cellulose synthase/poly-beta-1,6-N-acetylglucosamine synthase-like glycosyltransferase
MKRKSAVLVAYREPGYMEENVKRLLNKGFEVVVAVDEPNDEILRIIRKYGLKATLSDKRRGKWRALNDAVKLTTGEYILFLDSDTRIIELDGFDGFDAVEIRKEVNASSIIERLTNIDYFNMFLTAKLASKFNSCLSLNGSAFVIRRDILLKLGGFRRRINEDTDLGIRLGLNGYRVGVCGRAITKAPSSLKEWLIQRERWSLGGAEVVVENIWKLIGKPRLWLPYLFMFYPAIVGFTLNMVLPDGIILKLLYFILPLLLFIPSKILCFVLLAIFGLHILKNLVVILVSFLIWAVTIAILSKIEKYKIDFKFLSVYYFVYSPLWTILCIIALVRVAVHRLIGGEIKVKGWKI